MSAKPTADKIADCIEALLDEPRGICLCGRGEYCELCSSGSHLNILRAKLRLLVAELRGTPIKDPTPDDYRRSITIPVRMLRYDP